MNKSPGITFVLSLLFGPLGSIYVGLRYLITHILALFSGFALLAFIWWVSPDIARNVNFAGAVLVAGLLLWFFLAVGAMRSVSAELKIADDAKAQEERRHQEILQAIREGKDLSP